MDINIDDKRSICDVVVADNLGNEGIKEVLEYLRIKDKTGVKTLTINIILQAVDDLESLYKRTKMFYDECASGNLISYYKSKNSQNLLPFNREEDTTALEFFYNSKWRETLLESLNIDVLPTEFRLKVDYLIQMRKAFNSRCIHCLRKAKANATRTKKNKIELGNASK